jgi:cytidyltransferase-like protein
MNTEMWNAKRFSLNDSVRPWNAGNQPIVLVTGYFDLLHAGHVRFLQASKKATDELLIVGIHSDKLTTRQKGPDRPILILENRIIVVQSLRVVDYVFEADCFYDEPPYRILDFVQPDYVVLSQEEKDSQKKAEIKLFLSNWRNTKIRVVEIEPPILHTSGIIEKIRNHNFSEFIKQNLSPVLGVNEFGKDAL